MSTKTKMCEKTTQRALGGARWLHLMVLMLVGMLVPQGAWALDEIVLDGKPFYVLRNSSDWDTFCQKVADAKAGYEVNAIMAADFSVSSQSCGREGAEFCGTFDGNGHTLDAT